MQQNFNMIREKQSGLNLQSYENDFCFLQFHGPIEIYMVDEGEMEMLVNGNYKRLGPGEISVALSYDAHYYKTPEYSKSSAIFIPPHLCEEFMTATKGKRLSSPYITDRAVYKQLKTYFHALQQEGNNPVKQAGYLYLVLGVLLDAVQFQPADKPVNFDLASEILFYISQTFKEDITLTSVAAHFGYNPSYISRYFRSTCGIPLVQYLTAVRLKNAVTLMHEKKYDISYCALESGFSSMRTFYRSFYNAFSCTPKAYMQSMGR